MQLFCYLSLRLLSATERVQFCQSAGSQLPSRMGPATTRGTAIYSHTRGPSSGVAGLAADFHAGRHLATSDRVRFPGRKWEAPRSAPALRRAKPESTLRLPIADPARKTG